jgi:hypothetical protein
MFLRGILFAINLILDYLGQLAPPGLSLQQAYFLSVSSMCYRLLTLAPAQLLCWCLACGSQVIHIVSPRYQLVLKIQVQTPCKMLVFPFFVLFAFSYI